jgi:hypothetical protein
MRLLLMPLPCHRHRRTSYNSTFNAPFPAHERLRSPMRNKDLEKTETSLVEHYHSSYNRVGE